MDLPPQESHIIQTLIEQNKKLLEKNKGQQSNAPEKPISKNMRHDWPFVLFMCLGMAASAALHFYVMPETPGERMATVILMSIIFTGLTYLGAIVRTHYNETN